jgi:periplasmic nitrate reductase NapD
MADRPPPMPRVDRRKFLNGRWPAPTKEQAKKPIEIASILVQVRPERVDAVARTIERLPGSQIYSRSPQGKLAVVIEADNVGDIGATLNAISSMPHVLSAALVFHGTEEG